MSVIEYTQTYLSMGLRPLPVFHPDDGCQCNYKNTSQSCDLSDSERSLDSPSQYMQCYGKVPMDEKWQDIPYSIEDFNESCNVALQMGRQRNGAWLVAIDVDGELDWPWFQELPETMKAKTGRGTHYIFTVPPETPLANWKDVFDTRSRSEGYRYNWKGEQNDGAVDIRYCRGAIVAPPSKHKSGEEYAWEQFILPAELPSLHLTDIFRFYYGQKPHLKRYFRWSDNPSREGKEP